MLGPLLRFACLALLVLVALGPDSAPAAASTPRVTVLGDSIAAVLNEVPQARELLGRALDLRLDLRVCRRLVSDSCPYRGVRPPTALDVVKASGAAELGGIVVIDVGYNDPAVDYGGDLEILMRALADKGVERVIWVTLREQRTDYRTINQAIRRSAARWPQIQVADWDAASRGHDDWFNPDGLHLNGRGAMGLAKLLRTSIVAACASECMVRNEARPAVRGVPRAGRTLSCLPGSWSGPGPIRLSYAWIRNGRAVPAATASTYRARPRDTGTALACRVRAAGPLGSGRATSKTVRVER